jgi:transposase-like protein
MAAERGAGDFVPPARCPVCRGTNLTTTSKTIDASTYWRCITCGEVWNLQRHAEPSRFGYRR